MAWLRLAGGANLPSSLCVVAAIIVNVWDLATKTKPVEFEPVQPTSTFTLIFPSIGGFHGLGLLRVSSEAARPCAFVHCRRQNITLSMAITRSTCILLKI